MKIELRLRNSMAARRSESAFTCRDLLALLACLALLMAVALPLLASNRSASDRAVCQNNLRQIGRAFNMWADDHGGHYPYDAASGSGAASHPLANNAWYQFLFLQAELESPRVLACPTDTDRIPATVWFNPLLRNGSISYTVGLGTRYDPRGYLSSDRNINSSGITSFCCAGPAYDGTRRLSWDAPELDWTGKLHNKSGNILRFDGSVIAANQNSLRTAIFYGSGCSTPSGGLCVIYPD